MKRVELSSRLVVLLTATPGPRFSSAERSALQVHVCMRIHVHACVHAHTHACVYACAYMCMHVCMCKGHVLTEGNTLLADKELEMIVILRT